MRILIITVLVCFINTFCSEKFIIVKSTSQEWTGGRPETGNGTYYELTIVPKTSSDNLRFDRLWVGKKYFEVSCFQKGKRVRNNSFGKGDTITIRVNHRTVKKEYLKKLDSDPKEIKTPKKYSGEALLSYIYKSKRKYIEIETFTKLEPISYP